MFGTPYRYFILVGIYLLYACTSFFTKFASLQEFLSLPYLLGLTGAFVVMAAYALLWQQIIKRVPIAEAYMFKGTGLVWGLLICYFFFGEAITTGNIVGSVMVIVGIALFAKA